MKEDFLFKTLEMDPVVFEKIKQEIAFLHKNTSVSWGQFRLLDTESALAMLPTAAKWFEENNLQVKLIAYISLAPKTMQSAHTDSGKFELALNFPVINCNWVSTEFFKFEQQDLETLYTKGTNLPYHHFNIENKSVIGSFRLKQPTLLNIKMPHRVVNRTKMERISLSFRFAEDPWHLV